MKCNLINEIESVVSLLQTACIVHMVLLGLSSMKCRYRHIGCKSAAIPKFNFIAMILELVAYIALKSK
jgi:hypothetical protein